MTQTPQFKIIPDGDELGRIERDLRFHTLGVENPSALTREQIAAFNRDGFLKCVHIFNQDEIATHRRHFDDLLERVVAAGGDSYSISTAHLKYPQVYDLLAHPRIVAVVKDLLGEDVIGWGSHYFCKMPRDGKRVSWHQDASYWPLTPSKTVTVWLAIDNADVENACMRFIPGSHLYGHLTWRLSEADEDNVLNQSVSDVERFGAPVDDVLRAGEISIHSDLTLHGSEANDSDRRRCGLTLRYCAAEVRAYLGWNAKGVVVSGADADGHWENAARPE
ncbi:MAG TPA: phytanoyl-CoA dioxygenase family protein [Blastocatellia bacterium]|jgi:ectoine hydroxylase-related dioxygenase (phytanoyl-CoA dioxygenase family)|nr:phytanoyl-CoA dioxygenase family protein [Blastocatellia bacterium]